jgi:hypothetical protein
MIAVTGSFGVWKRSEILLDPQRGHFRREARRSSGKFLPRVQMSVLISRSYVQIHSRMDFMPSRLPNAHRAVTRHPSCHASPSLNRHAEKGTNRVHRVKIGFVLFPCGRFVFLPLPYSVHVTYGVTALVTGQKDEGRTGVNRATLTNPKVRHRCSGWLH